MENAIEESSHFNPDLESVADGVENISNTPSQLFSIIFEPSRWFLGFSWYVILLIVVFGAFLFIQLESAIEARRTARKAKKEGLETANVNKMKGIILQTDQEKRLERVKKHVTFGSTTESSFFKFIGFTEEGSKSNTGASNENRSLSSLSDLRDSLRSASEISPANPRTPTTSCPAFFESFGGIWTGIGSTVRKIYNWWVVPWIYVLFRSIGLR